MLPQRRDVVQRQVAGGVAPAVTHLVVIDAEVIAQVAAESVDAGLTDIFAARAQDGAQRLALDHQLQQQLAQAEIQLCAVGQGNGERLAERGVGRPISCWRVCSLTLALPSLSSSWICRTRSWPPSSQIKALPIR